MWRERWLIVKLKRLTTYDSESTVESMTNRRAKLLKRFADAAIDLIDDDGGEAALVDLLSGALAVVRTSLAHAKANDRFESVIKQASDDEVEGWKQHQASCSHCGGH